MLNVFNVAHFILAQLGEITTVKLQKLLYYCQAWSLAWDGVPLFDEDFEAWANGPVCHELFDFHKGRFLIDSDFFRKFSDYSLNEDQEETIRSVLDYYASYSSQELSDMTHGERPWKEAREGFMPGEKCNNIISRDTMQEYYGGL